jgi:hypothetical protein
VLLRLPYLALTSFFTLIRLLPMSDTDKDIGILALRHQLVRLQRQIDKPRLTPADRAYLAALLHRLPRPKLRQLYLIVSPDTVLRWHHDLLRRHHAKASRPKRPGRPPTHPPHPDPRPAPGKGEPNLGLPTHPRRTSHAGHHGRPLHRMGDPATQRDRARTPSANIRPGPSSCAARPMPSSPPTSSKPEH